MLNASMQLNSISLSKNLIRALEASKPDIPPLEAFPKSHIVTFKYYVGVILFLEEDYVQVGSSDCISIFCLLLMRKCCLKGRTESNRCLGNVSFKCDTKSRVCHTTSPTISTTNAFSDSFSPISFRAIFSPPTLYRPPVFCLSTHASKPFSATSAHASNVATLPASTQLSQPEKTNLSSDVYTSPSSADETSLCGTFSGKSTWPAALKRPRKAKLLFGRHVCLSRNLPRPSV